MDKSENSTFLGKAAIDTVTDNPYQLVTNIYGIGFITADKIARQLGMPADFPSRYRTGIVDILNEASIASYRSST